MLRSILMLAFAMVLVSCGAPTQHSSPNRWADERLWPVLEAQEHRDTKALCGLLKHEAAEVREAAALAFASVQDTMGIPCLLDASRDEASAVRATAVYALGFVADSLTLERMSGLAMNEGDSTVQRAYLSASFLALQRNGSVNDPTAILYYLDHSEAHEQARAADALRRLSDSVLAKLVTELRDRIPQASNDVRQFLVSALGRSGDPSQRSYLERSMVLDHDHGVQVNALRALARAQVQGFDTLLLAMTAIPALQMAALEVLETRQTLPAWACLAPILPGMDKGVRIRLLGLAMKHGDAALADSVRAVLDGIATTSEDAYQRAAAIDALASQVDETFHNELLSLLHSDAPAVVRQAAFNALAQRTSMRKTMPRATTLEWQLQQAAPFWHRIFASGDAGLICAAAEHLSMSVARHLVVLFPPEVEQQALASLHPLRDLEGVQLIERLAARRDGLPVPAHRAPPFNHPISKEKLRALPQGQRYRITTAKGTIILATDVNETPASSLAFDSLVTAGYYNGKAFHRMVPNFVVQGGCPRGDGYGGMPWTLRTEIGRKPFAAGSVGLASAGRDTESCQFFITHSATPHLDGRYTRFGEVVDGMDVVWRLQVGDVMERVERVE